jgi:hypothetical protein
MKWKMSLILILLPFFTNAQVAEDIPHSLAWKDYGLKGEVYSLKEEVFSVNGEAPALLQKQQIRFNDSGKVDTLTLASEQNKKQTIYQYDEDGFVSAMLHYSSGKLTDSISFVYNRQHLLKRLSFFNHKQDLQQSSLLSYNRHGQLLYIRKKDEHNMLTSMIRYRHEGKDKYERIILNDQMQFDSSQLFVLEKDTAGSKWYCYEYAKEDSCTGMLSKTYNKEGELIEQAFADATKRVKDYRINEYDAAHLLTKQTIFSDRRSNLSYSYKFDDQGNWLRKEMYENEVLQRITTRQIKYTAIP